MSPTTPTPHRDSPETEITHHGAALAIVAAKLSEDDCPGHIASAGDPKICAHCGVHIDSLRPPEDDIPYKGAGLDGY